MLGRMSGRSVVGVLTTVLLALAMGAFNRHNSSGTYDVLRSLGLDLAEGGPMG